MPEIHPITILPLLQAMDETAFEVSDVAYAIKRGFSDGQQQRELAAQLRALADRLDGTHGGVG